MTGLPSILNSGGVTLRDSKISGYLNRENSPTSISKERLEIMMYALEGNRPTPRKELTH
jgi:hypothetical protein